MWRILEINRLEQVIVVDTRRPSGDSEGSAKRFCSHRDSVRGAFSN